MESLIIVSSTTFTMFENRTKSHCSSSSPAPLWRHDTKTCTRPSSRLRPRSWPTLWPTLSTCARWGSTSYPSVKYRNIGLFTELTDLSVDNYLTIFQKGSSTFNTLQMTTIPIWFQIITCILCLTLKTNVTSARIPEEDSCQCALNLCLLTRTQMNTGIYA